MPTFNGSSYINHQTQALLEYFTDGGICEITGEFLHDELLTKLFPGYEAQSQGTIIQQIIQQKETNIIYCINAKHIVRDKQLSQKYLSFEKYLLKELAFIHTLLNITPHIVITMLDKDFIPPQIRELEELLHTQGYATRHFYPDEEFITDPKSLTIVTSYGTDTGKSSLCNRSSHNSSALWASLPLATLSANHPLNLVAQAYEYYPHSEDIKNLSVLEQSLDMNNHTTVRDICKTVIIERIDFYRKLVTSGHGEEETVEQGEELLRQL